MDRRNFLKISAVGSATVALDACGKPEHQLIHFIPEEELIPGVAEWKPGVCTQCPAGCGLHVRVMEGEAEVTRHGQLGLLNMGLAKKLEGNPGHPVNQGRLCAWGQAGLQVTYNPDRIRFPLKRSGPRGSGEYQEITWEEAIKELVSHLSSLKSPGKPLPLAFLTGPLYDHRSVLIEHFLEALGASPAVRYEFFEQTVLCRANELSFGHHQLPTFDLANANYVISFGADFLGTWNSPVAQNLGYGTMRQGRPGHRGKFVQVEARMSQTGANADEWVYAKPGTEGLLALGVAHVILSEKLRIAEAAGEAGACIDGWSKGLPDHTPEAVAKMTGVEAGRIQRLAREMAAHTPAVAIIGGAPLAQTNGLANALAANALNGLLGSVEKPGGIFFTPQPPMPGLTDPKKGLSVRALAEGIRSGSAPVEALLIYNANPVFGSPTAWRLQEALGKVSFIASFGSFVDETSILSDLILPDHSYLESWVDNIPQSGTTEAVASLAPPAMSPLHHTRSTPDVLLDVAHQLGGNVGKALPWKTYQDMLQAAFDSLRSHPGSVSAKASDDFWSEVQEKGGWWSAEITKSPARRGAKSSAAPAKVAEPQFDGSPQEYPFNFLPYASLQFGDGRHANLPWMQEMPDTISTAMWSVWLEINPETADRLGIKQGDLLEVASQHGKLQAPALIAPGIAPDVVAMPVGQGHESYGRYASQRGANPIKILAAQTEPETGALAWASTRVKITRVGKKGQLILFAGGLREWPREYRHR
ncbi:MAG TPA: molybdopterin-dependent oxidoreductase [Terriglobia bacterium]|nr:molybdopterin-dependent oxidoreductase [Terriglobia bacterium]